MSEYSINAAGDPSHVPYALRLDSDLGAAGAEPLRLALLAMIQGVSAEDRPGPVLLEAASVDRLGTGALQSLLAAARTLQELGRQLRVVGPSPNVREYLRIAGADYILHPGGSGLTGEEEGEV